MIYLVEDDTNIRELVTYTLNHSGLDATGFERPSQFWKAMEQKLPDLVLLDIMLPEEDGLSILRRLRAAPATASIPILLVSAKNSEYDKVMGLDNGADDYLAKPFGMMEMVSRVKAVLRRANRAHVSPALTHKGIELNESSHQVFVDGKKVELTVKEYQLLRLFLKNPGVAFTRENLLSSVWESEFQGETRTVDVHIASLRMKLGSAGEAIKTVRGVGYRLEEEK